MKFEAQISSGALQRQLARLLRELEPAVLGAAADAGKNKTPMRAAVQAAVRAALSSSSRARRSA